MDVPDELVNAVWWYVKILHDPGPAGNATDALLTQCVGPLCDGWLKSNVTEGFFFLRYIESEGYHLRLRAKFRDNCSHESASDALAKALDAIDLRSQVVPALYEPEVAKYGGAAAISVAEQYFCASSRLAIDCLEVTGDHLAPRMMSAIVLFDDLLRQARLTADQRTDLLKAYVAYWSSVQALLSGQRATQPDTPDSLRRWWKRYRHSGDRWQDFSESLGLKRNVWQSDALPLVDRYVSMGKAGALTVDLSSILANLAHTFHNRLGLSLRHEVILANLLLMDNA